MHKEPKRRYRSAEALIRDIDHYLKGEPLEARPDSLHYRFGKFVKRNQRSVTASLGCLRLNNRTGGVLHCSINKGT
jgi:serine/threonine-protein kinase